MRSSSNSTSSLISCFSSFISFHLLSDYSYRQVWSEGAWSLLGKSRLTVKSLAKMNLTRNALFRHSDINSRIQLSIRSLWSARFTAKVWNSPYPVTSQPQVGASPGANHHFATELRLTPGYSYNQLFNSGG